MPARGGPQTASGTGTGAQRRELRAQRGWERPRPERSAPSGGTVTGAGPGSAWCEARLSPPLSLLPERSRLLGSPDWGPLLASRSPGPSTGVRVRAPQTGREKRPGEVPASPEGSDSGTGGCPLQKPNLLGFNSWQAGAPPHRPCLSPSSPH